MFVQLDTYVRNMDLRKFNSTEKCMIEECERTYEQIRDVILCNGNIIDENEGKQIYVFTMKTGKYGNDALVALILKEKSVYIKAYAKEGLLKQDTCERALRCMNEALT